MGQGEVQDETRMDGKAAPPGVWRLVLCRYFEFPAYFDTIYKYKIYYIYLTVY